MRYVARNEDTEIVAVFADPPDNGAEALSQDDPELLSFIVGGDAEAVLRAHLAASDSEMVRIVEDIINVLIDNNVFLLTDFPEPAQQKLLKRQKIREKLQTF